MRKKPVTNVLILVVRYPPGEDWLFSHLGSFSSKKYGMCSFRILICFRLSRQVNHQVISAITGNHFFVSEKLDSSKSSQNKDSHHLEKLVYYVKTVVLFD